jgi:hypothetical protein
MCFVRVDYCSCCKGLVLYARVVLTCDFSFATGSSLSKSEHTVVDLGHGGAPRLVSECESSIVADSGFTTCTTFNVHDTNPRPIGKLRQTRPRLRLEPR